MFTQCPRCSTVYSLSPADLSAAEGFVRCGQCDTTFNALADLRDTPPPARDPGRKLPEPASPADEPAPGPPGGETDDAPAGEDLFSQTVADETAGTLEAIDLPDGAGETQDIESQLESEIEAALEADLLAEREARARQESEDKSGSAAGAGPVPGADADRPSDTDTDADADTDLAADLEADLEAELAAELEAHARDEPGDDEDGGRLAARDAPADKSSDDASAPPPEAPDTVAFDASHSDDAADDLALDEEFEFDPNEVTIQFVEDPDAFEHQVDTLAADDDEAEEAIIVDSDAPDARATRDAFDEDERAADQVADVTTVSEAAQADALGRETDERDEEAGDLDTGSVPDGVDAGAGQRCHIAFRDVLIAESLTEPRDDEASEEAPEPEEIPDGDEDLAVDAMEAPLPAIGADADVDDKRDRQDLLNYLRPGLKPWQKILGTLAALLLLAMLAGQAVHHWRSQLILHERYGVTIQRLYERFGRTVRPAVSFRDYDVVRHTAVPREDDPGILQLRATVINRADGARPPPWVRITFYNRFGEENLVRTFAPSEYGLAATTPNSLIKKGERVEIELDLANVDPDSATNYLVEACAPLGGQRVSCGASTTGRRDNR